MMDVSTGSRREVVDVKSAVDMETAVVWLLRGGTSDTEIHCYLRPNGSFGVWIQAEPADADVDNLRS